MRSPLLLIAGLVALAAACGGKTSGNGGETCSPLPGCSSSEVCTSPGGCGGECYCNGGAWECPVCGDDVDAYPPPDGPDGVCPASPPTSGDGCSPGGLYCPYGGSQGDCGETCLCTNVYSGNNGTWQCSADPCSPPSSCPTDPPTSGTACDGVPGTCEYGGYGDALCGEGCYCDSADVWSCGPTECRDAGPPDVASPCPGTEPAEGSACPLVGNVCTYFTSRESNCLCTDTGWVCATESDCGDE
jgi:hypothetical protein